MVEKRKLAAILAADVVGFSRLTGVDEDRPLARLRALRSDLIDPTISVHNGRVFKRTGDGALVEFRSVVDAVRCAIEVQNAMVDRNAGVPEDRRIEDFRIGLYPIQPAGWVEASRDGRSLFAGFARPGDQRGRGRGDGRRRSDAWRRSSSDAPNGARRFVSRSGVDDAVGRRGHQGR